MYELSVECPKCPKHPRLKRDKTYIVPAKGACLDVHITGHCPLCRTLYNWTENYHIYLQSKPQEIRNEP